MEKQIVLICVVILTVTLERTYSTSYTWCRPCVCSDKLLSCVQQNLREINIVSQIPSVVKVSFVGNDITTVRASDFLNVNNLQILDLTFNEIRTIDAAAFKTLTRATKIDISFNKIERVAPDTFYYPNRLEYLLMEENYISDINFISEIRNCLLIELNLSFNTLTHIKSKAFSNCWTIENLQLSDNYIKELDPQSFDGLNELRVLNLAGNKIKSLNSAVCPQATNLRSQLALEKLDLSRNSIAYIPSKAFTNCSNLRTVLLSHNDIHRIEDGTFVEILGENWTSNYDTHSLECTGKNSTFTNSSLTYVDLSHNNLGADSKFTDIFQFLKYLSYLDLSHNMLRNFSPSFICLIVTSEVIIELEENYFHCDCGLLYDAYLLSKKFNLDLNLTCSYPYFNDDKWDAMDEINCDDPETRVRYVVIFSLVGLIFILAVSLIFARIYYVRTKAAREINPDL